MRILGKIVLGLFALIVVAGIGGWVWVWGKPVGVNNYINKVTLQMAMQSPEILTSIGAIDNTLIDFHSYKLDDHTKAQDDKFLAEARKARAGLDKYGPEGLEGQELLSWQIAAWFYDDIIRGGEYEFSDYRISQISGATVGMPRFLTDSHVIVSKKSAKRYIMRLNEFGRVLREEKVRVEEARDNGVIPPDFIIEKALTGMRSFIEDGAAENPLVTTLPEKLDKIEGLSEARKEELIAEATKAVETQVIPGYEAMIDLFENELLPNSNHDAGIWRIPNGDAIYAIALKASTTTDMSADEIHQLGLSEVARINLEMDAILRGEGLEEGSVAERVQIMMTRPDQVFSNDDAGRAELLAYLNGLNKELLKKAPDFFITLPPQELEIVRIPEFSQDSAPGGYYSSAALDGSRPGRFYINLKDTADNPKWTLPTLMYHEGAPGHHFQISVAQNIKGVPFIRTLGLFGAYTEGWALYSEYLAANDMGMYDADPLGDLGRLQAEMFRAVRLVVDTGMHAKRWSREEAITYMVENTGMTEAEVTREIERYVVWPGQATSYKVGQLAILKMRARAETELGADFDLRDFNETVLSNGAMPLGILEQVVDQWIAEQKGDAS
jgi:uncharacterized protein (DUF885 family)